MHRSDEATCFTTDQQGETGEREGDETEMEGGERGRERVVVRGRRKGERERWRGGGWGG